MSNLYSKILLLLSIILSYSTLSSGQGIGVAAWLSDPGELMQSGIYQGLNLSNGQLPDLSNGWAHFINVRHSIPNNNYQFQIESTYNEKLPRIF